MSTVIWYRIFDYSPMILVPESMEGVDLETLIEYENDDGVFHFQRFCSDFTIHKNNPIDARVIAPRNSSKRSRDEFEDVESEANCRMIATVGPLTSDIDWMYPVHQRDIFSIVCSNVKNRKSITIHGPYQSGKTTLLWSLRGVLKGDRRVKAVFIDLSTIQIDTSDEIGLLQHIQKLDEGSSSVHYCLLLDEFQSIFGSGEFLSVAKESYELLPARKPSLLSARGRTSHLTSSRKSRSALLGYLFPVDERYIVVPQYKRLKKSVDFTTVFVVRHKRKPIFFIEVKPLGYLEYASTRSAADEQMRARYNTLFDDTKETHEIMPKAIPSSPDFTIDTTPAERWGLDILTAEGEERLRRVIDDVKTMCKELERK
ncbi:hypothetical protein BGX38DRAFT_1273329 [Terfezia claveryi]|nr:hypothetical protein BGX38DRAFT_1273329 [Terfezia claveryi]